MHQAINPRLLSLQPNSNSHRQLKQPSLKGLSLQLFNNHTPYHLKLKHRHPYHTNFNSRHNNSPFSNSSLLLNKVILSQDYQLLVQDLRATKNSSLRSFSKQPTVAVINLVLLSYLVNSHRSMKAQRKISSTSLLHRRDSPHLYPTSSHIT